MTPDLDGAHAPPDHLLRRQSQAGRPDRRDAAGHSHYIEPFCGSLAVLLAKQPAKLETVNDLDRDLMTFWKVLRDRPAELVRLCALTPHSRAEHDAAYGDLSGLDDLERARRVWVRLTQGRTGTLRKTGWRFDAADTARISLPARLNGYLERMHGVAERLARVSLEYRDALEVIEAYGRFRGSLLYVDPPYPGSTRERNYRHEMTGTDAHRTLAEALHRCRSTVVVSGYACELYDTELYAGWHRYTLAASTSQGRTWENRTEVLWSNRPLNATDVLFDARNETRPATTRPCNERPCEGPECGLVVRQAATGRPARFCSTACRVAAHRAAKTPTT
ncbi:DNA adenine methylase [Nonomuraea sp. NPDC048881]|uniref:DNA adenine methylase n=1 Tax=Nonomuraea sp. NPDC048881 TaxID=3155030 RepID=UPI0033FB69F0